MADGLMPGTTAYRHAGVALFLLGFATFSLVYCVQPLLPVLAADFGVSPAESALALSLTTATLAVSIVLAGAFSQGLGRRGMMFTSMALASLLNIVAALLPGWHGLLVVRTLEGAALGGVPAIAMAWLAEEIHPAHLGRAMGLYVAGTAFGGMAGRVGMGLLTQLGSWRLAMGMLGVVCLLCTLGFLRLLPPSRHFTPQPVLDLRVHLKIWAGHLASWRLLRVYGMSFLLMSVFVTLFNYMTFRLAAPPFGYDHTTISLMFLLYGFGMVSSSMAGTLADRHGRKRLLAGSFGLMALGALLTLSTSVVLVLAGISCVTIGFFAGHAVASGAVGPLAGKSKGHAASLYLLFYYLGASVVGLAGGWFWSHGGWHGVAWLTALLAALGMALALTIQPQHNRSVVADND